jgi:hypothetical protein
VLFNGPFESLALQFMSPSSDLHFTKWVRISMPINPLVEVTITALRAEEPRRGVAREHVAAPNADEHL